MTCALCSKHVYNKSITVVAAPLRNSSGMYCIAYFRGISRTMLGSARVACAFGIRAAYIHIFMHTLVYLNIWILTISEHIFPAACPRTIIKYLANKCVRTLIHRILFFLFIQYLCNFCTILAPDFSIWRYLSCM